MKIRIFTAVALLSLVACTQETTIPEDLEGRVTMLNELKKEMKNLEERITEVQDSIDVFGPKEVNKRPVSVISPQISDFKHYISVQGSLMSDDMVNASSDLGGRIIKLNVQEGQNVKRGQLIANLDLENLDKQRAELLKSLELAEEVYARQERLWNQNIGSEIQYLQAKNNKERLEKSLETLDFTKEKSKVYAPISGSVLSVNIKEGEMAGPGMPIITLLNISNIKVTAEVPESYLKAIKKGDKIDIELPALGETRSAKINLIGNAINPANRTFKIEAALSNRDKVLKPNLLANVKLNDYTKANAVSIPVELVQQEVGGKSFVYSVKTVGDNSTAQKLYVTTGEVQDGKIIITEGLKGDEKLISEGARMVVNNEVVEIKG
jgi:membrane fusion protein (multidrug efflux system)